jgi:hypothetical protein
MKEFNKVHNVNVWGIHESIIASGYPMRTGETSNHDDVIKSEGDMKRAITLGNAKASSGHDSFLKGIIVQFDWTISQTIYPQVERYHFIDIVSSQSKMHRIQKAKRESFNQYVDEVILNRFMEMIDQYNQADKEHKKELFYPLVYSLPMGFEMTARFTTNYLQLKTIYHQRKNHKLDEWKDFCEWAESLPQFKQLVLKN